MSAGLRQLQRGSERHKQAGPALGLSSVRRAAGGFFPHWGVGYNFVLQMRKRGMEQEKD